MDVGRFVEAVRTVAAGGTAIDPEVIAQLLAPRTRDDPLHRLTARESEVLALMAEGRTNAGIAARMAVGQKTVSKHSASIFDKLGLAPARTTTGGCSPCSPIWSTVAEPGAQPSWAARCASTSSMCVSAHALRPRIAPCRDRPRSVSS